LTLSVRNTNFAACGSLFPPPRAGVQRSVLRQVEVEEMQPSRMIQRGFRVHPDWVAALKNIQVVLVGTTHPGNIGAVSRVMKNMGLSNLRLVYSTDSGPETAAFGMSSGAYDLIERAGRFSSPVDALADVVMAVAASSRLGRKRSGPLTVSEAAPVMLDAAMKGKVACVFGRESRGLTNEEIKLCTHSMIVPTNADFASMNLAQSCAVVCYELFKIACRPVGFQLRQGRPASVAEREGMLAHIETTLVKSGFLQPSNHPEMMRDIRRIFNNGSLDERDVRIVRGVFRKTCNRIRILEDRLAEMERAVGADNT
jgi:tRNA (cytidine32/uridine32-2'-O)-methyltransferase